ncbi:carbon-nitrogen hydrolase [Jackrogersella minutella]|nr:carbon-nitrogen hydrolase [Jackrogersella minutella]
MMAKAAIGQICASNSMAHNLKQCVQLVGQAAAAGAKILFLPEASDYIGTSAQETLSLAKPVSTSPFVRGLQSAAASHQLAVHVGIHVPVSVKPSSSSSNPILPTVPQCEERTAEGSPEPRGQTKLFNRTIYIRADGTLCPGGTYDKLHLFDYPDASLRESATTQAGSRFAPPFPSPVGRLGSLICFDLRFPEAAVHLTATTSPPAQILLYPSAFTVATGRAHWEVLLRARAVETQSYVVAAAQVGTHNPGLSPRASYGRSMVVDPWGRVVLALRGVKGDDGVEAEDGAVGELGVVDIDLDEWERVRAGMPLVRRTDVYPEV